jgi:hypothetical protein
MFVRQRSVPSTGLAVILAVRAGLLVKLLAWPIGEHCDCVEFNQYAS